MGNIIFDRDIDQLSVHISTDALTIICGWSVSIPLVVARKYAADFREGIFKPFSGFAENDRSAPDLVGFWDATLTHNDCWIGLTSEQLNEVVSALLETTQAA